MKKKLMIIGPVVLLVALFAVKTFVLAPAAAGREEARQEPGPTYTMKRPVRRQPGRRRRHPALRQGRRRPALLQALGGRDHPRRGRDARPRSRGDSELRDIVISTLQSTHQRPSWPRADGRDEVKKQIVTRVNKQTDYKIVDVYYTEFAVQ